ncbi:conserved hypothetical protein [Ricinus communis]|uniref:Uncharacterized protein n=1 Tax=Ricinus communis TaxID=3988 RepID=B9REL0_RICCO|nr:conserved hypothetical protein [Ricinus communis]
MVGIEEESSEEEGGGIDPTEVVYETELSNHQFEVGTDEKYHDDNSHYIFKEESHIEESIIVRRKKIRKGCL